MLSRLTQCLAALTALIATDLRAADLIVDPGDPGAYPSLQAALNAAMPGDRILLATSVFAGPVDVQKSVTIESLGAGRQTISLFSGFGDFRITALSPGIPLTFRRINFALNEMAGGVMGMRTVGSVPGEIRFDQVDVRRSAGSMSTVWGGGSLVDIDTTVVWLRETTMTVFDMMGNNGCIDLDGTWGTDCLVVTADTLRMEDCDLRASSANHLAYACCFGMAPNCSGQFATGGRGGSALLANTRNSILVRCSLSDGNGGTVQPGPWLVSVSAGPAGTSVLGGQTGIVDSFAVTWEAGLPGQIGAALTTRGATTALGPGAPLTITGPASPGTFIGIQIDTPGVSAFLLGLAWGETPTALGPYWVAPFEVLLHPGFGAVQTLPVPNLPFLIGLPVVSQSVQLLPVIERNNPSGVAIR